MRILELVIIVVSFAGPLFPQQQVIADPPEVRGPFTLSAVFDSELGHKAFAYLGQTVPPVIRAYPGDVIKLHYMNKLREVSNERCALGPCSNMTNLHFHGLHVSPNSPQDDVLNMMAMPGDALDYSVEIPSYAPPGLYWYHTHPHGESARQDLDGMSGAIVVEGIDRYYPQLRQMRERILILRDQDIEHASSSIREGIKQLLEIPSSGCGTATERDIERVITVNGKTRPKIPIKPGERQFWRIVNTSPDRYTDIQLGNEALEVVALDGMPLNYHDHHRAPRKLDHVLLPPGGRVEAIVTGPPAGSGATLSTRCVDTGPDGDANPSMVIADLGPFPAPAIKHQSAVALGPAVYKEFPPQQIRALEASTPDFTVAFTEDKNGFYINGREFEMNDAPMLRVKVGSIQHWRIVNATNELHPFHIHQVHFLAYAQNGVASESPEWLDTVNVPYKNGTVDLIMDFTDPIIRGMSVFHCHLLNHEDKGMMAKILFE